MIFIPSEIAISSAKKMLVKLKKNIIAYINTFKEKINSEYLDYLNNINTLPDERVTLNVSTQNKKGVFELVPISFNCPLKVELNFMGLLFNKATVEFIFPDLIIGENFILPEILISIQTYKPWFGNFGLAWEGITGVKNKIGFYPYENQKSMQSDIKNYFAENIVDPLCDFINNYKVSSSMGLKRNIARFITKKERLQYWKYSSVYKKKWENIQEVPIRCEYNSTENISTVSFRYFAVGNGEEWIPVARILLDFLNPISEVTSYFNDSGELLSEEEIEAIFKKQDEESAKKKPSKKKREREKLEREDNWDPFKAEKELKRDEFGFMMDRRNAEFGSHDVKYARNTIIETASEQKHKILEKDQEGTPEIQNISKWKNASEWYNDFQGKRFIVMGTGSELNFKERGELMMLKGCKPPFILRFARDNIRLEHGMIGSDIQKLMFKFYRLGYLRLG